jgi:MgtE intracellular N domain
MLALTAEIGQPVLSADGLTVGRVIDVTAHQSADRPRVDRLAVGRRHRVRYLLPWSEVGSFEHTIVRLRTGLRLDDFAVDDEPPLAAEDLLLVRDVLDTQIVDVDQHRVARVAEVLLDRGPNGDLDVVGVAIGLLGVLRRLGLQRLGGRLPDRAIEWKDLHLTSDRGHAAQLTTRTAAFERLDSRELAELLTRLRVEHSADVIQAVGPARAAGAVARTHPDVARAMLRALEPDEADRLVRHLPPDTQARYRRVVSEATPPRRRILRLNGWRLNRPPESSKPSETR